MVEIILLAMVALFIGLRLFSVLGRRTGHEQPVAKPAELAQGASIPRALSDPAPVSAPAVDAVVDPAASDGIRAIVSADPRSTCTGSWKARSSPIA